MPSGTVSFRDAELQQCFDRNLDDQGSLPDDTRQVRALLAAHDLFHMLEGPHSARVHEAIEQLLSTPMRPELRQWYQRAGAGTDPATVEFRDQLSHLAGERLDRPAGNSTNNPS